jgi:methionyl-tRNA formyltransferase
VGSGDGALRLEKIQLAGKKVMKAADFARGRPDFVGSILGT